MIKLHLFRKDKHFIHIKKDKFINDMRSKYSNSLNLLDQFKEDYELIEFKLNGKPYLTKSELLNYIISKYDQICNEEIFEIKTPLDAIFFTTIVQTTNFFRYTGSQTKLNTCLKIKRHKYNTDLPQSVILSVETLLSI